MKIRPCLVYMLVLVFIAGCGQRQNEKPSSVKEEKSTPLKINGGSIIPTITKTVNIDGVADKKIRYLLENSGLIKFNEEETQIKSVGDVSLDYASESWGIRINGVEANLPEVLEKKLESNDSVEIFVKKT